MNDGVSFMYIQVTDATGTTWEPFSASTITPVDPFTPSGPIILTDAILLGWNGSAFEKIRVAHVFKTADIESSAAPVTVWTPATGKKFVLMGFTISAAGTLAAPGVLGIDVEDGVGNVIWSGNATMQDTLQGDTQMGADFGQGYVSGAINRSLVIEITNDVSNGSVVINAWGIEI